MNPTEQYFHNRDNQVKLNAEDRDIVIESNRFMDTIHRTNYVKNWSWMGVPILQLPTDMFAMAELIWKIEPTLIIECGVAFGGLTLFMAGIIDSLGAGGCVVGIDIDIRTHTRSTINHSCFWRSIELRNTSSLDVVPSELPSLRTTVMVVLDSNHTHDHVLQELKLYSPLVSLGSYIVVFDTSIEYLDPKYIGDRPWGRGNSPGSAVKEFLKDNDEFVADEEIENRILLTSAPGGWLRRIKVIS